MFKPLLFSLTALSFGIAQGASAADYTIHIEEGAFYPEITYIAPGDTVTFINNQVGSVEAISSDETWTTGPLATNASYLLAISTDTALQFALASDAAKTGSLSFDFAPLTEMNSEGFEGVEEAAPEITN